MRLGYISLRIVEYKKPILKNIINKPNSPADQAIWVKYRIKFQFWIIQCTVSDKI